MSSQDNKQFVLRKGGSIIMVPEKGMRYHIVGPRLLTDAEVSLLRSRKSGKVSALQGMIQEGFVEVLGASNMDDYRHSGLITPGVHDGSLKALDLKDPDASNPAKPTPNKIIVTTQPGGVTNSSEFKAAESIDDTPEGGTGKGGTPWGYPPAALQKKPLDDLNLMIMGLLPEEEQRAFRPYETAEEAIAHLSQDYHQKEVK